MISNQLRNLSVCMKQREQLGQPSATSYALLSSGLHYRFRISAISAMTARPISGCEQGVHARIQLIQPKALFAHCFAHTLNLSVPDAVRSIPLVRDGMQCLRDLATIARGNTKGLTLLRLLRTVWKLITRFRQDRFVRQDGRCDL